MSSFERDYLVRLTQALAELAARMLRLSGPGEDAIARAELKEAARALTGLDLELLLEVPPEVLHSLLDPGQRQAAQVVLQHEGERAQRAGDAARAAQARRQAAGLVG
ncbi:MAG: hypothetical protein IPG45_01345 [Deltaproteobacteria bacterium]|nr:hypothetical protein [Deltaproteobacteria bacterium]